MMSLLDNNQEMSGFVSRSFGVANKDQMRQDLEEQYRQDYERRKGMLQTCLSLLLYLCSQNAEIEYPEDVPSDESTPDKGDSSDEDFKSRKFKPRTLGPKTRTAHVGYRIGEIIRYHELEEKSKRSPQEKTSGTRAKAAAHVRRGHYHHFWTGSHKDNSRKLILKWVAPTFVNGHDSDDLIPTIHNIK